ncbi:proline-rich protein 22 [Rhinatrema bivittatum]|uniref:proline-rich protein 22 n=1 Tax=Rhinatrema bivittatum TaxID=194408 RepID=UPI00112D6F51|nr:proline-rich protein 22 [Rhinatrema bivittatum]
MQHNISPSLQSFGLPETPVLIGQSSEYLHPSQEKIDFKNHPAGLQMAPCGCFFDPRIYRIEWAPDDFPQSPVFKVMGGPGPQNVSLPDSQRYMKTPGQPASYSSYQPPPGNSQHVLSAFSQESPPLLTEQIHFAPTSLHEAQGLKILNLQKQGVVLTKEIKVPQLVITIPGLKHDGHVLSTSVYNNLNERLHQDPLHQTNLDLSHQSQELQKDDSCQDKGRVPNKNDTTSKIVLNTQIPTVCTGAPSNPTNGLHDSTEQNDPLKDNNIQLEVCQTLDVQTSLGLPEEVLLEDAMKMFDCIPGNRELGSFRNHSQTKGSKDDQGIEMNMSMAVMGNSSPCKGSLCDINSLNLPGELLSPDYTTPEVSDTVSNIDYFYNFLESNEEDLNWEDGMTSQPSTSTLEHDFTSQQLSGKQKPSSILVKNGQLPPNSLKKRSAPGSSQTCAQEHLEV